IKKPKPLPEISEEEKPFELPEGWEWMQISEIGHDWGQKTPDEDFTYIDVGSINKEYGIIEEPSILSAKDAPSRARKIVQKGTVIYSTIRPYLLNIAIIESVFSPEPIASTAFAIIHPYTAMNANFIYYYLRSPVFINYVESCQTGVAYPAINDKQFFSGIIAVPPSSEQVRITKKIIELMSLCDQLEQHSLTSLDTHQQLVETLLTTLTDSQNADELAENWARISEHFDTLFTTEASIDALKQTILQLAVMGKLVPQDPNDEPASELLKRIAQEKAQLVKDGKMKKQKPLPPISDEEKPFELPYGWEWRRLGELIESIDAGWSPACSSEPAAPGKWGVLKTTAVQSLEYREYENKSLPENKSPRPQLEVKAGDILITRAGPKNRVGISCLVEKTRENLMISDKIIRFHLISEDISAKYISLCLNYGVTSLYLENSKSGMAESQMNISQDILKMAPVAIPTTHEQLKIIDKINEMMDYFIILKNQIQSAKQTQLHLADALTDAAIN
ncbi:TPA: restriction endonuclease subunit S, partial [Raoultella ornithinolytica]|nr:restriction endonuclease subunit S [Raoultella ornithinolytica]